jgi:predicted flap endonuclease-1-like 5' DNA nuclease
MFFLRRKTHLPAWLWFFVAVPLGLLVTILYRKNRLPHLRQIERLKELSRLHPPTRRYTEPDSIPIDMHYAAAPMSEIPPGAPEAEVALDSPIPAVVEPVVRTASVTAEEKDDLKIIEGIGPAIAQLMNEHGISSLAQLAETPVERLKEILDAAGLSRLADPATWPEQAALGAAGRWDELRQLQATLKGGRRKIA